MDKLQNWRAAQAHLKVLLQNYPVNHPEQLDSEAAELVWCLGYCYSKQAKDKDAIDCYKRALANDARRATSNTTITWPARCYTFRGTWTPRGNAWPI